MTRPRKAVWLGSTSVLVVAGLATMGLRSFFDRPGESALVIVPKSALAVIVFDFQPGPGQLGAFRKLQSSVNDAGIGKKIDKSVSPELGEYAWIKDAVAYMRHSGVVALVPAKQSKDLTDADPILILPVSDTSAVAAILRRHLTADGEDFVDSKSKVRVAIVQDAVVIAQHSEDLAEVKACAANSNESFVSLEGYQKARRSIDSDANLMVFISDTTFRSAGKNAAGHGNGPFDAPGWFGGGFAVRDEGVAFSCNVPLDGDKWAPFRDLEAMLPVRADTFNHLPAGAYQVAVISQPSAIWRFIKDVSAGDKGSLKAMTDLAKRVDRETGINLDDPNSPVLKGTTIFASYPSTTKPTDGYDALIVVDDSNGARPADVAEGIRQYAERVLRQNGNGDKIFTDLTLEDTTGQTLTPSVREKEENHFVKKVDADARRFLNGKTIAYATVDEAVLVATSDDLLARAVRAYRGEGDLLSHDSQFATNNTFGQDGPQIFLEANVKRIGEGVDSGTTWNHLTSEQAKAGKGAIKAADSLSAPSTFALRAGDNAATIHLFIPMDYDKLAKYLANLDDFMKDEMGMKTKSSRRHSMNSNPTPANVPH